MTRHAARTLGPGALVWLLAACSPGDARQEIYVHASPRAFTTTRIFAHPATLADDGREVTVGYTVEETAVDGRESYPGQPQRIEGAMAFDCQARRYRRLRQVSYGFDGRAQPADAGVSPSGDITPDSEAEVLLDYACAGRLRRWWTTYPVVRTG